METKTTIDNIKLSRFELIFLIASASVTITFVSCCSPLFPFNPWDDVNVFFVIGRGIIHGLVPYRDLFDHKGPLLHFIYALAALISERSFAGVWLIECAAASVYSVFSWKTVKLFTDPGKFTIAVMPLFSGVIYTMSMFNFGGNSEELCFPLLAVAFYFGLRAAVKGNGIPADRDALICGIISGALFWIKYTFLGFMAGFVIFIIIMVIRKKMFGRLWSLIWRFFAGLTVFTVPVLIYFIANGALGDLWEGYFRTNLFYYHGGTAENMPVYLKVLRTLYYPCSGLVKMALEYPSACVMILLSLISFVMMNRSYRKRVFLFFFLTFALSLGFVFSRNVYVYYYGYLLSYIYCLALIPCIKGLQKLVTASKQNPGFITKALAAMLAILYVFTVYMGKNKYLMFKPKDFTSQCRIAETIRQTPDAKVLVYGVIDSGFYTAAGILPQNKYFCYLNICDSYPYILEEQNRLIEEGYFDYIITYAFPEEHWDNYEKIQEETNLFIDFTCEPILEGYNLYKRI